MDRYEVQDGMQLALHDMQVQSRATLAQGIQQDHAGLPVTVSGLSGLTIGSFS